MTAVYERTGVRFQYPENWRLEYNEADPSAWSVSLESPEGAVWSLHVIEGLTPVADAASNALQALLEEYEDLESEPYRGAPGGDVESEGFEIYFYVLDLLVQAVVECFHWHGRTAVIITQAENRDFERLAPVFCAITFSMLQEDGQ